jgi:dihydrofolate reductase
MSKVMIHATVSLDGFMADLNGGVDWMNGFPIDPADEAVVARVVEEIGAVVGGANKTQTIEDGEIPYGGILGAPVFLMTHSPHEPVEKDGIIHNFVVEDVTEAVTAAKLAAGEKWVSVLGGSVSRQCLEKGLVDEIVLDVVPILLGNGISLFTGLGERITLERLETSAFASEVHLRYRVLSART